MESNNSTPIRLFACDESILNYHKEEKHNTFNQECKEGLHDFIRETGMSKMNILPNFHIGNILGPVGYVAEIPLNKRFHFNLFDQPMFREISFFEISVHSDTLLNLKTDENKDRIRKCIPLQTPNYPDLKDDYLSSWSPALGYYGSSIGIYSFEEKVGAEQIKRYFIGVHSGLHSQTYDLLANMLVKLDYANMDILQQGTQSESTTPTINTYAKVIQDSNKTLFNMRKIAISNNKRLAYIFARTLGLKFKNDITYLPVHKRLTMIETKKDYSKVEEILNWWPKNTPLYINSTIAYKWREDEKNKDIEDRISPSESLEEMAIGEMYKNLLEKADEEKKTYLKKFEIDFQDKIGEAIPIAECDYNTFRIQTDYINFYNSCSPTTVDPKEPLHSVIRQLSMVQGYEIYNSTISRNDELRHMNEHMSWTNKAGNGFMTLPVLEKRQSNSVLINEEKLSTFFSLFNDVSPNRKNAPKQMKYIPRQSHVSEEAMIKAQLFNGFDPNVIQLTPEFVYLSPDIPHNAVDFMQI